MSEIIDVPPLLAKLETDVAALIRARNLINPAIVGIHTGGAWIAQHLHQALGLTTALGRLDISFYRDDFTRIGINPQVKPSDLPFSVDDRHILLVDDVLFTGRTIRAALNELFDYGRPASIALVTLVDRGGRELPIQADAVGMHVTLARNEQVKLHGPTPLTMVKQKTG